MPSNSLVSRNVLIVIPARIGSTRFPRKPFVKIEGVSLLERVWRIAKSVKNADNLVVATDSEDVAALVRSFGGEAVITPKECRTGTDRVWSASQKLLEERGESYKVVVSLQGDAVLTPPWVVESVIDTVLSNKDVKIATPAVMLVGHAREDFIKTKLNGSSSGTTVVFNKNHDALYFSKSILPAARGGVVGDYPIFRHIGFYVYSSTTLQDVAEMEQTVLEKTEQLEQLRALENGIPIRVVEVDYRGRTHASVDNPGDVSVVEEIIAREGELI